MKNIVFSIETLSLSSLRMNNTKVY